MIDVQQVAGVVTPPIMAAVRAYGTDLWDRVRGETDDHTAGAATTLGHRLLRRLLVDRESAAALDDAVRDAVAEPDDEDTVAALRHQLRKVMAGDAALAQEIAGWAQHAGLVVRAGLSAGEADNRL